MTKQEDIGLQYLKLLKLQRARDTRKFYSVLSDKYGKEFSNQIRSLIEGRADGKVTHDQFYPVKNASFEKSMDVTSLYDADVFRQCCNWIDENRDFVNGKILDVGCDNGIITCFIARNFPNSTIVGIDKYEESINIARQLAQKLQLTNVTFIATDVLNYETKSKYDTIFSMRCLNENESKGDYDFFASLKARIDDSQNKFQDYSDILSGLLTPNGKLISFERLLLDANYMGWIESLRKNHLTPNWLSYRNVCAQVFENNNYFQACVYESKDSDQEAVDQYLENIEIDLSLRNHKDLNADIIFEDNKSYILDAFDVTNDGRKIGMFELWQSKDPEYTLYYSAFYTNDSEIRNLDINDVQFTKELIEYQNARRKNEISGGNQIVDTKEKYL